MGKNFLHRTLLTAWNRSGLSVPLFPSANCNVKQAIHKQRLSDPQLVLLLLDTNAVAVNGVVFYFWCGQIDVL